MRFKRQIASFFILFFILIIFQNCKTIQSSKMEGTVVTNPFSTKLAQLSFSSYGSQLNKVDMCLTNVLLRLDETTEDISNITKGISNSTNNNGFDVSYFYYDPQTQRYFLNGLVKSKIIQLDPRGTFIGEFDIPKGIYDLVVFGFSSCTSLNTDPSLHLINQYGEFSDRPENYFTLIYEGRRNLHSTAENTFPIDYFTNSLVSVASNSDLNQVLQQYRHFDIVGFGSLKLKDFHSLRYDSIATQSDGRVISLASSIYRPSSTGWVVLMRSNLDGTIDATFGEGEIQIGLAGIDSREIRLTDASMAIASDDSIYVTTNIYNRSQGDVGVIKLTKDGKIDSSFNAGRWKAIELGAPNDYSGDILVQDDGTLLVVGKNDNYQLVFAKLQPDGSFDTSFGTNGIFKYSYVVWNYEDKVSLALQSDGKIIAGGTYNMPTWTDWFVIRLNQNGTLDSSFGNSTTPGRINVHWGGGMGSRLNNLLVLPDDKILAVGSAIGDDFDFGTARLTANGKIDTSFGEMGKVRTDFGDDEIARECLLVADNQILVSGQSSSEYGFGFGLLGLDLNGQLDISLSPNGTRFYLLKSGTNGGRMAPRPDGGISIGGTNSSTFYVLSLSN